MPFRRCLVKTLNFEQGLEDNATKSIITDVRGFTWVSTDAGLQRYNGYRLENVTPAAGRDTFRINSPVSFFNLESGLLWIGCKEGVLAYSPVTGTFREVIRDTPSASFYFSISPIMQTQEGVWCLQRGIGLVVYDTSGRLVRRVPIAGLPSTDDFFRSATVMVNRLYTSSRDYIFIRDTASRIWQVDVRTHQVRVLALPGPHPLYIACNGNRLYILCAKELECIDVNQPGRKKRVLLDIVCADAPGDLFLTTTWRGELLLALNNRLFDMDTSLTSWQEFTTTDRQPILATGMMGFMYRDRLKRLWLLTNDDIKLVRDEGLPFQHLLYPNARNNFIRCLYIDEQKHLLLAGCFNGGLQLYDTLGAPLWPTPLLSDSARDLLRSEEHTSELQSPA